MDRKAVIAKLAKCQFNPIRDVVALEAFSDDGLTVLENHCAEQQTRFAELNNRAEKAEGDLKTLQEQHATSETKIKTLEADLVKARKPQSEEDWLAAAPESIRTLVENKKKEDEEHKAELVDVLRTAQDVYSEDALKAMSLEQLTQTAKLLKLDEPTSSDFSASRPAPKNRAASEKKDDVYLNPPDPYAEGIKKHQASYNRVN